MKQGRSTLILATLILLGTSIQSHACRCERPANADIAFAEADLVVLGDVQDLEGDPQSKEGQSVLFRVQNSWKKPVEDLLRISNRTTCAADLEDGKAYLLFLRNRPGSQDFVANKCFGNLSGKAAQDAAMAFPNGKPVEE